MSLFEVYVGLVFALQFVSFPFKCLKHLVFKIFMATCFFLH